MRLVTGCIPATLTFAIVASSPALAAGDEDIATLKRMVQELQAQNRELARRLSKLER